MAGDSERVAMCDEVLVFSHLVVMFLLRPQVITVHAFHTEKHLVAARPRSDLEIVSARHLSGREVALHHEGERYPFFFAQKNEAVEEFSPLRISRDIVVREEAMRDPRFPVALPHKINDLLRFAISHRTPLHIDDRAKVAGEHASASCVDSRKT